MCRGNAIRLDLRSGGIMPLTLVSLSLLAGVVALVVDGGTLMEARRHVQAVADAAALAAATDLYVNYPANQGIDVSGTAQTSALSIASANGFSNDGVQSIVKVITSPQQYQGGPNSGQPLPAGYVEVSIQYNVSRLFSGIFGAGTTPVPARAVARGRCAAFTNNAAWVLNLHMNDAFTVSSLGGLRVYGGVSINSKNSSALNVTSPLGVAASQFTCNPSSSVIESLFFNLTGGTLTPITSRSQPDPLRYLSPPDSVQLNLSSQGNNLIISSGTVNLYPGVYSGGIQISNSANVILHANSDGSPGIYYLQGQNGLQLLNSASLTTASGETAGVMIYNDWTDITGTINLNSSGTVTLTPPASGTYRGLSIFQRRGTRSNLAPSVSVGGAGNYNVTGTIYAAHGNVTLIGDNSTNVLGGQVIADTLTIDGLATVNINNINPGTQSLVANQRVLGLVE
jgi:hypothetical protein